MSRWPGKLWKVGKPWVVLSGPPPATAKCSCLGLGRGEGGGRVPRLWVASRDACPGLRTMLLVRPHWAASPGSPRR